MLREAAGLIGKRLSPTAPRDSASQTNHKKKISGISSTRPSSKAAFRQHTHSTDNSGCPGKTGYSISSGIPVACCRKTSGAAPPDNSSCKANACSACRPDYTCETG